MNNFFQVWKCYEMLDFFGGTDIVTDGTEIVI